MDRRKFLGALGVSVAGVAGMALDGSGLWAPVEAVPAVLVDPEVGISIRFVQQWDVIRDKGWTVEWWALPSSVVKGVPDEL